MPSFAEMTEYYRRFTDLHRDVLPSIPGFLLPLAQNISSNSHEIAACWLLAHLDHNRLMEFMVGNRMHWRALVASNEKWSHSERILLFYAADLWQSNLVQDAGYRMPGPGSATRCLDRRTSEIVEVAMAIANGRRHPLFAKAAA